MIGIVVENPYNGEINRRSGGIFSDKIKDTGIGLASVRSVANKYHGQMTVETENNIFRVSILLNI